MKTASQLSLILLSICIAGCRSADAPLSEYSAFNASPRVILPEDYAAYLKKEKFTHGELDHLPTGAIILHHADVEDYLKQLGYTHPDWTKLQTGETDPNVMYIVRPQKAGARPFIINRGLPGAGGISTQTAELAALGVKEIIHIGTAGFLGTTVPDRAIVISYGAYKDAAATMLSDKPHEPIARPFVFLALSLQLFAAKHPDIAAAGAIGYTSPISYYQPEGLIRELIMGARFSENRPAFVEMEEASFFETANRARIFAASIVIGSDRYTIDSKNVLKHDFFESTTKQELEAMKMAIDALTAEDDADDEHTSKESGPSP